jgi:hypothetical protein
MISISRGKPHGEKAYMHCSIPTTRTAHAVTTAYAAETPARVLWVRNQSLPEMSTGCGQIAPEYLGDRNPVRGEKISDKRHEQQ